MQQHGDVKTMHFMGGCNGDLAICIYIYIHVQCICMCRTACVCPCPCPCLCICICRLVPAPGTIYDEMGLRGGGGVGGWGGMLTFMWINVHVNLRQQLMLHTRGGGGWGGMLTFMWTCRSSFLFPILMRWHILCGQSLFQTMLRTRGGGGVGC